MDQKVSRGQGVLKPLAVTIAFALVPGAGLAQEAELREAQAAFERFRVARLGWSMEPGFGPCDEVVGRFCYRHETGSERPPPPEPDGVDAARDSLLARLDLAAGLDPANGWTAGQRVRYRIEAGRAADAAAIAAACGAEPWWCAALEGTARHAAEDFEGAERAFDRALRTMPIAERDRWTDLAPLLDGPSRRVWRGLGPGAREAFARRLWWAADPLWSVPGNEIRAEHFARRTWDRMQERAASAYDVSWGADLRELLVRYGWPVAWERAREDVGRLGSGRPGVVAHDPPGAKRFVPALAAIADPAVARADAWPLDDPSPRATYAPSYARRFLALDPQIAAFRRGAATILAAGWSIHPDSLDAVAPGGEGTIAVSLLASEGPDGRFVEMRDSTAASGGALWIEVPWPRAVVSVEALGRGTAARWRAGLELAGARPGLPAVSDLLLLERPEPLPAGLNEALPRARRAATARPEEAVGVFWETYPAETIEAPVTIALRLSAPRGGAELRWTETLPPAEVVPRSAVLRMPDAPPGDYVIELAVTWPDGRVARGRREIAIRR
ncbi:MAG TPA: hypothetical protein VFH69_00695 [Gemmatimonadota bacterium]|nr:hypothetical protein [Gemmatimonadota bacterium]